MSSRENLAQLMQSEFRLSRRSQADVAARLGISPKHLNTTLRGHSGMSLDMIDRVFAELGRELVVLSRERGEAR